MYLPAPAKKPTQKSLEDFCAAANRALPELGLRPADLEPRWIGLDADSTQQIFELIRAGTNELEDLLRAVGVEADPARLEVGGPQPKLGQGSVGGSAEIFERFLRGFFGGRGQVHQNSAG